MRTFSPVSLPLRESSLGTTYLKIGTEVPTFLIAGHETTSTETMWALFALAQAPDVQQKLRAELRGVPADSLDMDELNALPYLDMVVRETLRLHAAVNGVSRIAANEAVIPLAEPYTDTKGVVRHEVRCAIPLYIWYNEK